MSLNAINETDITNLSDTIFDLIKKEETKQLKDMKTYLNKTTASDEFKLKLYAEFSTSLFDKKISIGSQVVQEYIIKDKELNLKKDVDTAQIGLYEAQADVAEQERLVGVEKVLLTKEQTAQVQMETDATETKIYLSIAETKAKIDNTVANTLTEARKNGATVTSQTRSWTDPYTGITIDYSHLSLAAAEATDTTKGLIGMQMKQLSEQADTFKDHSKVQIANQIMQLGSTAIADGLTSITGILSSHKTLCENIVGEDIFSSTYTSIG